MDRKKYNDEDNCSTVFKGYHGSIKHVNDTVYLVYKYLKLQRNQCSYAITHFLQTELAV